MPIELNDSGLEAAFTLENDKTGVVDEPPFHTLVLGDWSGSGEKNSFTDRKPIEIDRDNFDEVMARIGTAVDLDFDDGSSLRLEFRSIDDFHPDEIFRRVEMFDQLRTLRKKLRAEDTYNSAAYDARQLFGIKRQQAPEAEAEPVADNLLDAILLQPEGGAAAPKKKVSGELGSLISELVRPYLSRIDEDEQATLVSAVDSATGGLMRSILHHRAFQEIEAAWRGLYFLVRRTVTDTDLKIFILDARKDELLADLKQANSLEATKLNRIVLREAVGTLGGEPWSVICGNYPFEPSVDDVAALMRISQIAAAANAPFISHMKPDVFGVHSLANHPDPKEWKVAEDSSAAKLWLALRSQPESKYLGMTIPRFIARLPYGSDTDTLETFEFEEFESLTEHDNYSWANGCFAAAMLLAKSFSKYGWQFGRQIIQDIDGLPVHVYNDAGETVYKSCAEIPMTDIGVGKLMDMGFIPLVHYRGTDTMKIARFQSIAEPVTGLKGRWSTE